MQEHSVHELDRLLAAYTAGEASPEQCIAVERWIGDRWERRQLIEQLRAARDVTTSRAPVPLDVDLLWQTVSVQAGLRSTNPAPIGIPAAARVFREQREARPPHRVRGLVLTATAATLGIVGLLFARAERGSSSASLVRTYATVAGERASLTLTDGSQVRLGPQTTLTVTTAASEGTVVDVAGEAVFTVIHSRQHPFRVQTPHALTRVLGTTFLVRRHPTDRATRVVVADGRVSLSSRRNGVTGGQDSVLSAGSLGVIDDSGRVEITAGVVFEDYTGWTRGQLVFRNTPAREAIAELSRAYGAELRITDSALAIQPLNATIPITRRSLNDVLESLVDVLDAHSVRSGTVITLMPGRVAPRRPRNARPFPTLESHYGR